MVVKNEQGLEIEIEIDGTAHDDIYVISGVYIASGLDATEDDLDYIERNYGAELEEAYRDRCIMQAESLFEDR